MNFDLSYLSETTTKYSPSFKSFMLKEKNDWEKAILPIPIGIDEQGISYLADLAKTGNVLIGGTTGSGKSIFNDVLICSLLLKYNPAQLRLFLVDPKRVEFSYFYNKVPHIIDKVYECPEETIRRLYLLKEEIRNKEYSNLVIVIDTFSDLICYDRTNFELLIAELSVLGAYIVLCDSRPSPSDVFTDNLMRYFPTRIAFNLSGEIDSKRVIGISGAEKLKGAGDMLLLEKGEISPKRYQGSYIDEEDVIRICNSISRSV